MPAAVPVFGDFVVFLEHSHKMVGMLFADIFDVEFVNTEGEADGIPFVCPKP